MFKAIKWICAAAITALAWLFTGYTVEYFKPYRRK